MEMISQQKRLTLILLAVPTLLLIPLVATLFSSEVNWTLFDYAVMGTLLLGVGLVIEMVLRKVKKKTQRLMLVGVILVTFLLIWAELAVGIIPNSPIIN